MDFLSQLFILLEKKGMHSYLQKGENLRRSKKIKGYGIIRQHKVCYKNDCICNNYNDMQKGSTVYYKHGNVIPRQNLF